MTATQVANVSVLLLLLALMSFYVSWRATRLDRLHTRTETATAALDAALARRHSAVLELASAPELEPASRLLLADAVGAARRAAGADDGREVELAESALSRALRAVVASSGPPPDGAAEPVGVPDRDLLAGAVAAAKRVHIARSFYNDAVAATHRARSARLVRLLRLAGRAPLPDFFEMDDEPPHPVDVD